MKKILFILLMLFFVKGVCAEDIVLTENRPNSTGWNVDAFFCSETQKYCTIIFRKGYTTGGVFVPTGEIVRVKFVNTPDDPDTPEDETVTEFSQLIKAINNGSNIKTTLINATKIKLGIN